MRDRLSAIVFGLVIFAAPGAAEESFAAGFSVSGSAVAVTDYVSRGISQTRSRPAIQGSLELSHESGVYLGTFTSNVAFAGTNARQELDLIGGVRIQVSGLEFDFGLTWFTYPGYRIPPGGSNLNYAEASLQLGYAMGPVTIVGTAAFMPGFAGPFGNGIYLESGADWQTPVLGIALSGRIGYQWVGRNDRYGTPDYLSYGIVATRELGHGFTIHGGWFGTNVSRTECNGGQKVCDQRFVAALSWKY